MLLITVNTMYLSFIIISAPFVPDCVLFCSNVNNKWMRPLFLACLSPNVVGSAINEREERYYDAWRVWFVLVVRFCSIINNRCVCLCVTSMLARIIRHIFLLIVSNLTWQDWLIWSLQNKFITWLMVLLTPTSLTTISCWSRRRIQQCFIVFDLG
jgi:hypothetical protein